MSSVASSGRGSFPHSFLVLGEKALPPFTKRRILACSLGGGSGSGRPAGSPGSGIVVFSYINSSN